MKLIKLIISTVITVSLLATSLVNADSRKQSGFKNESETEYRMRKFACNQMRASDGDLLVYGFDEQFGVELVEHVKTIKCGADADKGLFKYGVAYNSVGAMQDLIDYLEDVGGKKLVAEVINMKTDKNQNTLDFVKYKLERAMSRKEVLEIEVEGFKKLHKLLSKNGAKLSSEM